MPSMEITNERPEIIGPDPQAAGELQAAQEIAAAATPDDDQETAAAAAATLEPLDEVLEPVEAEPVEKRAVVAPADRPAAPQPQPVQPQIAEMTGAVLLPTATVPPEGGAPPRKSEESAEAVEEAPASPAPDAGGGSGRPPANHEIRTGGNDDDGGDDEAGDEAAAEPTAERREVSAEVLADREAKAAKAKRVEEATAGLLHTAPNLQHADPTFRVIDTQTEEPKVVVAYNQVGHWDDGQQAVAPPERVVYPLDDPQQITPVSDLPTDSPWVGGGEQPTEEHELTTPEIVKEMAAVTPEPEAIIFQDPQFSEALTAPHDPEMQVVVSTASEGMNTATVEVLARVPLTEYRSAVNKTLIDARIEEAGQAPRRTSFIEQPDDPAYIAGWDALQRVNVPVPEVYVGPEGKLLTTDFMGDGSGLYGKTLNMGLASERFGPEVGGGRDRPRPEADVHFLHVMDNDLDEVRAKAREYAERASFNGLLFAPDDPLELRVSPDGAWELVAGDLRKTNIEVEGTVGSLIMKNTAALNKFYETLQSIDRQLRPQD